MSAWTRPCDNPFNMQRVDALDYIEHEHNLDELADKLKRHGQRGAIIGPHGHGKTALMHALGEHLMDKGLSPLPLFMNSDQRGTLPSDWRRTIPRAKPTDVLLLDGYDLLPWWARLWVLLRSRWAGAVIVTAHRPVRLKTLATVTSSPALLERLIEKLSTAAFASIDATHLYHEAEGNLRDALRMAYDLQAEATPAPPATDSPAED